MERSMRHVGAPRTASLVIVVACLSGGCGAGGSPSTFGSGGTMTTGTAGTSTGSGSGTSGTGTSSTSTGGVIMTGGRDAASGAGGGLLGDAACVSTAIRGDQRPVTLY